MKGNNKMRIIITGGTGLIGRHLVTSLAADGHEVIVLSRNPAKHAFPPGARGEKWNGRTAEGWGRLADGADAIINLAGENLAGDKGFFPSRWTAARKQRIVNSRTNAGQAVVEAVRAVRSKPGILIQASAVGYYGPGDQVATEAAPPGNDFMANVLKAYEASTAEVEAMGLRRVVMRSGVVLTTEGGALPRLVLPHKLFVGGPLGNGRQWLSWIHMADEIRAIRFLLENESASGAFNVTSPEPLTYKAFGRVIGQVLGRPSLIPVPAFALRLVLGEVADTVLTGQRVVPQRLQEMGFTFRFPDPRPALADLLK
jgi:uncharacterized protein (TIGR01777 family)